MTKYKKHTIEVTQKHIDEGVPNSCTDCALSLAFKDSLGKAYSLVKVNVNHCLVRTNISDGEVQLSYSHNGIIFGANLDNNCFSVGEYRSEDLQNKINAFVDEYDTRFIKFASGKLNGCREGFTPKHCVPFTFDVRLPV